MITFDGFTTCVVDDWADVYFTVDDDVDAHDVVEEWPSCKVVVNFRKEPLTCEASQKILPRRERATDPLQISLLEQWEARG